jgi:hypothetical protein
MTRRFLFHVKRNHQESNMNAGNIYKRLRGAAGNAVVWGAGWSALSVAVFAVLKAAGFLPDSVIWLDAIMLAAKLGFLGGIAGGAFSLAIGVLYRGRHLSEISAVRFGAMGGIMAGVFVPLFLQAMNLLSGDGMVAMALVMDDALLAALFGAVAAGGSLKLAQRADPLLPDVDHPGLLRSGPLASAGDARRRTAPAEYV